MKRVAAIMIIGGVLSLTVPAYAGRWQVSGYVGSGYVTPYGWSGEYIHISNGARFLPPGGGPHIGCPSWPWTSGDGIWHTPHGRYPWPPRFWGTPYAYTWSPPVYYGTPVYVVSPWVDSDVTVITGSSFGYGAVVEEGSVMRMPGVVYAVPSGVSPAGVPERLEGVGGGVQTYSDWTSPDRPRRNLNGIERTFKAGGIDRAEAELGRLLRSNPSDAQLSYVYAYVLFLREKYATASFVLRRAWVLDGELGAVGRSALQGFYDAQLSAEGLDRLNRRLEASPVDDCARLVRAYVLFLGDRKAAAREDLAALLKADATDPQAARLLKLCTPEGKTGP